MQPTIDDIMLKGWTLRLAHLIWGGLTGLAIIMMVGIIPISFQQNQQISAQALQALQNWGFTPMSYAIYLAVIDIVKNFFFLLIGVGLFIYKPRDRSTVIVSLALVFINVPNTDELKPVIRAFPILIWFSLLVDLVSTSLLIGLYYILPNGRFVPSWSSWGLALCGSALALDLTYYGFWGNHFLTSSGILLLILAGFGSGLMSQLYRYFYVSTPLERQQTKWFILGLVSSIVFLTVAFIPSSILPNLQGVSLEEVFTVHPLYNLYIRTVGNLGLLMIPITIATSVLRYRLWEVNMLLHRAIIYVTVTILLGLGYGATVLFFQQLFYLVSGHNSPLTVALSTLLLAILFNPIYKHIQQWLNRWIYRRQYKALAIFETFSDTLQNRLDLAQLTTEVVEVVYKMLEPAQTSLWLVAEKHNPQKQLLPKDDPFTLYLQNGSKTIDLAKIALSAPSPVLDNLKNLEVRTIVPLISQAELVGLIALTPFYEEQNYTLDERRLLNELATKVAPAIRLAQLVQEQQNQTRARERLDQEMRVAQQTQQTFLPKTPPTLLGWRMAAYYQPARAVGGDFYDFIALPDGCLGLVIGDVTDKGVPAAMVMVAARVLLNALAPQKATPSEVLMSVNQLLCPTIPKKMFVTCFYAILQPKTGHLQYANAGHDAPYLRHHGQIIELEAQGFPLGLFPETTYPTYELDLAEGDALLFYSDGLIEAHNSAREMFGFARLEALLLEEKSNLLERLLTEQRKFTGAEWEQEDDVTIVTVERQ